MYIVYIYVYVSIYVLGTIYNTLQNLSIKPSVHMASDTASSRGDFNLFVLDNETAGSNIETTYRVIYTCTNYVQKSRRKTSRL